MALHRLDRIESSPVNRLPTGIIQLDWSLGDSILPTGTFYGLPKGRLSYWSGSAGIGKTRTAIQICKNINSWGGLILVFQGEVRPQEFRQWTDSGPAVTDSSRFFVSDDRNLETVCNHIETLKPTLVVIDSANMLDGFNAAGDVREIFETFKALAAGTGTHIMMLGHLTKGGLTKGNSDVEHLVDVVCKIRRPTIAKPGRRKVGKGVWQVIEAVDVSTYFTIDVHKNRYGPSGGWVTMQHRSDGIVYIWSSWDKAVSPTEPVPPPVPTSNRRDPSPFFPVTPPVFPAEPSWWDR